MLNDEEIAKFRSALLAEQATLAEDNQATAVDRAAVELDQQSVGRLSRMDALQRQAMAQAISRRRGNRDARITAALARIDAGEFGYCIDCGDEIETNRLMIDATLPTCVSCARG